MSIYVSMPELNDQHHARLREVAADETLIIRKDFRDNAAIDESFKDCEIVLGNIEPGWVSSSAKLRWIQLESVGFGEYRDIDWAALDRPVTITNLSGLFAAPVAQTALAGILALQRGIDRLVLYRQQQHWEGDPLRSRLHTLNGAKVVLFGHGAINRELEKLLLAFDCTIFTFKSDWQDKTLNTALQQADIVITAVPETDRTVGVFAEQRLALLGDHALFVNCGRGSVVDENALATALQTGRLGGAVLDVTLDEPLPGNHAFWSTPNTILTQHSGGGTADELDRKIDVFAANLQRYRNNQLLQGIADFKRGY